MVGNGFKRGGKRAARRRRRWLAGALALCLAALVAGAPSPARAQSPQDLLNQAVKLQQQGQWQQAIQRATEALQLGERQFGSQSVKLATTLYILGWMHRDLGQYGESEGYLVRALGLLDRAAGGDDRLRGYVLGGLGQLYSKQGRYADAERTLKRGIAVAEPLAGRDPNLLVLSLNNLGVHYQSLERYEEAEQVFARALELARQHLPADHLSLGTVLNNLGLVQQARDRLAEAAANFGRAREIFEKAYGVRHPQTLLILNNLGWVYGHQGRFAEAEPLLKQALDIHRSLYGADHPESAVVLMNYAGMLALQSRFDESEALFAKALEVRRKAFGTNDLMTARILKERAYMYLRAQRDHEAEIDLKQALAVSEAVLGGNSPGVAEILELLGGRYGVQGRHDDAIALLSRAAAIYSSVFGNNHSRVAVVLNRVAHINWRMNRFAESDKQNMRALAIFEAVYGKEHPWVADVLQDLGLTAVFDGRDAEAEADYRRALAINEKVWGKDHLKTATSLGFLAMFYRERGRYAEAEPMLRRALVIYETLVPPDHPSLATASDSLARTLDKLGRLDEALSFSRRAVAISRKRAFAPETDRGGDAAAALLGRRYVFVFHVDLLARLAASDGVVDEAFQAVQLAQANVAANAVARMGARFAASSGELAKLVRRRQDAAARLKQLDARLVKTIGQPMDQRDAAAEAALRTAMAELDRQLGAIDGQLAEAFPGYVELANPQPVPLAEAQALLAPDEALLSFLVGRDQAYLIALRRDRAALESIALPRAELDKLVRSLRAELAPERGRGLKRKDAGTKARRFDLAAAHRLYQALVGPAAPLLDGVRHLMLVPDGPLESLPLGVLVTAAPERPVASDTDYREVAWLAKTYATTVLPSVGALRVLRRFKQSQRARQAFVGFGDPLLGGAGPLTEAQTAALTTRGAVADAGAVRQLARLPDTAVELKRIAKSLAAGPDALFLRERATETRVKSLDLAPYRTIAFATHGLMAGEFRGLGEPALVLTPPRTASERDDGLLTAGEIAELKLNADWVVLSACNTAAPDGTPGAGGLSGLAKAFFYAGTRALLVSHWAVDSDAAVDLTTRMFAAQAKDPKIGRAEALRRSRLAMLADADKPAYAHPRFWAPFVVVGEGGGEGAGP